MENLKPNLKQLELLKEKLQNDLAETITVNHLIGVETITIGEFLDSGIVSEKIKHKMPDYHEDYLVYPTMKVLNKYANESKGE